MPQVQAVLDQSSTPEVRGWEAAPAGLNSMAEICPKGKNKAEMLDRLMQTLVGRDGRSSLSAADCMAFGDGLNDITMLKWAGVGVAMGNTEAASVTAAADRATETNDNDGVAIVLEELLAASGAGNGGGGARAFGESSSSGEAT